MKIELIKSILINLDASGLCEEDLVDYVSDHPHIKFFFLEDRLNHELVLNLEGYKLKKPLPGHWIEKEIITDNVYYYEPAVPSLNIPMTPIYEIKYERRFIVDLIKINSNIIDGFRELAVKYIYSAENISTPPWRA